MNNNALAPLTFLTPELINRLAQETIKRYAPDYVLMGFAKLLAEVAGTEDVPALHQVIDVAAEVQRMAP